MSDDIHRHLDGELPLAELDEATREEAEAWDRLVSAFRIETPRGAAPPWLEQRVMAEIDDLPERGPLVTLLSWLVSPRPIRVSPLTAALVVAAFALVIVMPGDEGSVPEGTSVPVMGPATFASGSDVVYVQFVLEAPNASSVSVAGDFSDWEARFSLEDPDQDGIWSARVPVTPGVHTYMFLIDGTDWQTDPRADRYQDDGFGNRNAVLAVAATQ